MWRDDLLNDLNSLPRRRTNFDVLCTILGEPDIIDGKKVLYNLGDSENSHISYFYLDWLNLLYKGDFENISKLPDKTDISEVFKALFGKPVAWGPSGILYKFGKGRYAFSTYFFFDWWTSPFVY